MPRHRKDNNHAAIQEALEKCGLKCINTSQFGSGYPDLVAIREDGRVLLVECKGDDTPMTGAEVLFVMQLVNPCYRIFYDAEQAARSVMDG